MKVVLNQTVPKVGKAGTVVTVANGYARNFLFPRGLAVVADKGQMKNLDRRLASMQTKLADTKVAASGLREQLHGKTVRIEGKVGRESTKLFGAVTSQDVADAIREQLGVELEKKQIGVLEPIKRLGQYSIEIDLHREVDAVVKLEVFDPTAPVLPEQPAERTDDEAAPEDEDSELTGAGIQ